MNLLNIIFLQLLIVAWFALVAPTINSVGLYLVSSLCICAIHQRLISEWLHEGLHYNIHKIKINEFVSSFFSGINFALPLKQIRKAHFTHHSHKEFFSLDDLDTSFAIVKSKNDLLIALFKDLSGYTALSSYTKIIISRLIPSKKTHELVSGKFVVFAYFPTLIVHATILTLCFFF